MRESKYPQKTILNIYPETPELFSLVSANVIPWREWNISGASIDSLYFFNHSGDKLASPYMFRILGDNNTFSVTQETQIANLIKDVFFPIWERLFADYDTEFNPLQNFTYSKEITETHNDSGSGTHTKGTSETRTLNLQDSRTADRDVEEQADRSAYNSSTYQPVDKIHTDDVVNSDITNKTGTDTLAHTGSDSDSNSSSGGYHITEARSGFNGAYPYQDIIRKDRELWMDNYFNKIFRDIDTILALPVYPADVHRVIPWSVIGYPNI